MVGGGGDRRHHRRDPAGRRRAGPLSALPASVELDPSARLHVRADGGLLLGGQPFRVLRLSGPAAAAVARWRSASPVVSPAEFALARRLHAAGLAVLRAPSSWTPDDVTVVVPVHERDPSPCLSSLAGLRVVVVDDASDSSASREAAERYGAAYVRLDVNAGPAAARNAGLRVVTTPLVGFVDSDVVVPPGWLPPLLDAMTEEVDVVAPRVVGVGGTSLLARYEAGAGPLDLGPLAGPVAPGARVGHVPAAALLCRVSALGDGFDEALRVGEDVDLVWRLAGRVRYEPRVVVTHEARASLAGWLRQRHGYGRSAALLDERHPGSVAPVVIGRRAAPVLLAALTRRPLPVAAALGLSAASLRRRLPDGPGRDVECVRLAVTGPMRAGAGLADGAARAWLPALLPLCAVSPLARRAAAVAVAVRLVRTRGSRPGVDPLRGALLCVTEDVAYATGVWRGAVARRRWGAVAPGGGRPVDPARTLTSATTRGAVGAR